MTTMRWIDGQIHFGSVLGLTCDRASATKIMCHLITRGVPFATDASEGTHYIFVAEDFDLSALRRRLKDIRFNVET